MTSLLFCVFLLAVSFEPDYSYEVTSSQVLPASFTVPLSPVAHAWVPEVNVSHFFQIRTTVQCHTEWYINQTDRRGSGVHTRRALYNITCSGPRLSCDAFIWEEICSSGFPPHPGPEGNFHLPNNAKHKNPSNNVLLFRWTKCDIKYEFKNYMVQLPITF